MSDMLAMLGSRVSVSGQIGERDLIGLKAAGVDTVVNNRPDNEGLDQPAGSVLEAAARAAGMDYVAVPIHGLPAYDDVSAVRALLDNPTTRFHMFCKSGLRSAAAWAMAETSAGRLTPEDARTAAAGAGFDLSRIPL